MRKSQLKRPDLSPAETARSTRDVGGVGAKCSMPHKLMLQLLGMTAGLTLSAWGYAVGLGGINVVSALGQPLKAEIELVAVSKADKPGLVARLATPDAYKGAGLDYPYGVQYSFDVGSRANGEPYLKLSSNREINDPFVSLLVELSWASGKLMREYTFLLDPPGYVAVQPKSAPVQPVAPEVVHSAPLTTAPASREEVRPVTKPAETVARPVERTVEKRVETVKPERIASAAVTVKRGDTLNKVAVLNKPADISLDRMIVALYRANADQFDGKNMNRIQSGKILRIPDHDEVVNVAQAEAVREIHAQAEDWNAYRQKLAGAATSSHQNEATSQVATGKISAPAADKTPVASQSAKEVLRLSKGQAPDEKSGAAARTSTEKRNAAEENAIAKAKAVEDAKTRAALLEANLKDMQRLAQLKSEAAALSASAANVIAETEAASQVAAVSSVASAAAEADKLASQPAAASQVMAASAVPAPDDESVMDKITSVIDNTLGIPAALGLGAAAMLAGLGIALARRRKNSAKQPAEQDLGATTGHLTTPVAPSPDTGDFRAIAVPSEEVEQPTDEVDPISEADLFLNFGRDEQAEEVLKDALLSTPDNHQVHLKLLGIYAKRQDAAAFAKIADLLEKSGDADAMRQAEVLAEQLQPDEASIEDAGSATQLTKAYETETEAAEFDAVELPAQVDEEVGVDSEIIDFDVTSTMPSPSPEVDFDVTSTTPMMAVPDVLDFDIAGKEPLPSEQEEALPNLDDLIFDIMPSADVNAVAKLELPEEKSTDEDDGMEFTLDFPLDEVESKPVSTPPAINLADISLNMDDVSAPVEQAAETEKSERWHEVATKLDLARAYQEMGDEVGSREILEEVLVEGDESQQQEAQLLIKQLS